MEAHQNNPDAEVLLFTIVEADFENIGAHPEQLQLLSKLQLDEMNRKFTNSEKELPSPLAEKVSFIASLLTFSRSSHICIIILILPKMKMLDQRRMQRM